jgi:hypothetical protein
MYKLNFLLFKLYFTISFFVLCKVLIAQLPAPVITQDDIAQLDYEVQLFKDTIPDNAIINQILNNTGSNQTWDFSSLKSHDSDTITFIDAHQTNYFSSFPSADVCALKADSGKDSFIRNDVDGLFLEGNVSNILVSNSKTVKRNPALQLMRYPCTYADTLTSWSYTTETFFLGKKILNGPNLVLVDSIKYYTENQLDSKIDAYGIVSIPNGSYSVLRQNTGRYQTKYVYEFIQSQGWLLYETISDTVYQLSWWAEDSQYPVVECTYSPNTNQINGLKYSSFRPVESSSLTSEINTHQYFSIYPNPCNQLINLFNIPEHTSYLLIHDCLGKKEIEKEIPENKKTMQVGIQNLLSGLYFCSLLDKDFQMIENLKFVKPD